MKNLLEISGQVRKMRVVYKDPVEYHLSLSDKTFEISQYIGKEISLEFLEQITCIVCKRKIKKTFNQGYCFPCFRTLFKRLSLETSFKTAYPTALAS